MASRRAKRVWATEVVDHNRNNTCADKYRARHPFQLFQIVLHSVNASQFTMMKRIATSVVLIAGEVCAQQSAWGQCKIMLFFPVVKKTDTQRNIL
jgi:hypothetical protein